MRSAGNGLSRGAVCAVALISLMYSPKPAVAADDAAHALAEKFSHAGEESERAEEAKAAKVRAEAQAAAKKQAEAAKRKMADKQRADDEAEMLRAAKQEAEARRQANEAREQQMIETERQAARADAQRLTEEALKQKAEMDSKAEAERSAEAARLQRDVEEQRVAEEKRLEDEHRIAAEKKAEAERLAEAARAQREAEERRVAEEKKAEAARVAEAKRRAEEARVAELKRQAEEAEAKRQAEEARLAEAQRRAEEARVAEERRRAADEAHVAEQARIKDIEETQQRSVLEAKREQEAKRIAEKFRLAREAREREHERDTEARSGLGGPLPEPEVASPFIDPPATASATYPQRVTVLVIMQPRRHGFGGRRMTANPVLCVGQDCYVSNGAGAPATVMRRAQALGPGNTLGRNAGPCRNQTTCVFRGITLSAPMTMIQPVDMGFLRHDRRETRAIEADRSCDANGGVLACASAVISTGYRAWVVPEIIAVKAGALALERALDDGLPAARSASYDGWGSTVQAWPTR